MPTAGEKIIIAYETQSEYDSLQTKNDNCIYFITDTGRIFVGSKDYSHLMQYGQGSPSSQLALSLPDGSLYYDLTNKILYYNYSGDWSLLTNSYHINIESLSETDLNLVYSNDNLIKYYFVNYSNASVYSNRPEQNSNSFILIIENQNDYRAFITIQTYKNSKNEVYQRKIIQNPVSGNVTYNEWIKIYPISEATTSSAGLLSAADKTIITNLDITYLRNDDVVPISASDYESLVTKTAKYYLVLEE